MSMEVIQDTHTIVRGDGEIDLFNIAEFETALNEAAGKAPKGLIVDLSDVTYIDSAGVQAIFRVYMSIRDAEGCLGLVVGNPRIKSVLEVVHLEQLANLRIFEDLDSARQGLASKEVNA